jgi:uncharacterized protein with GYD domain
MPHYILLVNWTDQGVRNVKDSAKRAEAARSMAEKAGGKLQLFYTLGEYDVVGLLEMPNDEATMKMALSLGNLGNVRTKTLKAWTEGEAAKVVAQLP